MKLKLKLRGGIMKPFQLTKVKKFNNSKVEKQYSYTGNYSSLEQIINKLIKVVDDPRNIAHFDNNVLVVKSPSYTYTFELRNVELQRIIPLNEVLYIKGNHQS